MITVNGKIVLNRLKHSFWNDIIHYNMIKASGVHWIWMSKLDGVTECSEKMI